MAGAGYKLFNTGDVLTAAQVNTYLQEQTVMVFANSTARTTALSGVLAEGMVTYLKDTDAVEKYNGSAWVSIGGSASPLTTKGDLYTYSTADARLAVGNNGETLVADSSATTGLRYTPSGLSNPIINGAMDIWQRGTSFTVGNGTYLMDRWYNTGDTNLTVTRDTDVPTSPYFKYSAKLVGTGTQSITQKIESAESVKLAGQIVTISLYAKKTSGTGALNINIYYPSATDNFASLTQIGTALQMSSNPGSSWTRYSVTTSALPADVQKGFVVLIDNVNTHTVYVTGVQIDVGNVALPFRRAGGTLAGELAACQRYYYRKNASSSGPYAVFAFGAGVETSTFAAGYMQIPVPLRSYPSSIEYGGTLRIIPFAGAESNVSAISLQDRTGTETISVGFTGTGMTSGSYCYIRANNSSTAYIGVSAEL